MLDWFKLACRLGYPVYELKKIMPYTEFIMWQEFMLEENNIPTKMDYYLAQIATEIRRSYVKKPESVSLKDFLNPVKFIKRKIARKLEQKEIQIQSNIAKSFWFGGVGLIGSKNKDNKK